MSLRLGLVHQTHHLGQWLAVAVLLSEKLKVPLYFFFFSFFWQVADMKWEWLIGEECVHRR